MQKNSFNVFFDAALKNWGMRHTTAPEMLATLQGKPVADRDVVETRRFLIRLENVFHLAAETDRDDDFHRRSVHDEILTAKLPHLKDKWAEKRAKMSLVAANHIKFQQFSEFLDLRLRVLEEKTSAESTTNTPTTPPKTSRRNRRRRNSSNALSQSSSATSNQSGGK